MLALAFNELATNAIKHGILESEENSVQIDWRIVRGNEEARLRLRWREASPGLAEPPQHYGFGLELVHQGVPYELGGSSELAFEKDMLICAIEFPAAKHVVEALPEDDTQSTTDSRS